MSKVFKTKPRPILAAPAVQRSRTVISRQSLTTADGEAVYWLLAPTRLELKNVQLFSEQAGQLLLHLYRGSSKIETVIELTAGASKLEQSIILESGDEIIVTLPKSVGRFGFSGILEEILSA